MGVQLTYKTKQRDLLLEYLEANPERSTGIWNGWWMKGL